MNLIKRDKGPSRPVALAQVLLMAVVLTLGPSAGSSASRSLVIATSPAVKEAMEALGTAYESIHPDIRVRVAVDTALDLRRTIAGMENRGRSFIGSGPIHLIAPGGDELLTRLEQKHYVLPGAKALYATERLVLVVPESLSEAPESFEALAGMDTVRIAVADRTTRLGVETERLLSALRFPGGEGRRLDVASDQQGILDHVLSGQADVGIVFGHDAIRVRQRVRIAATAPADLYTPVPHSIAMERFCPDRLLCQDFLRFATSSEGQAALTQLGYGPGSVPETPVLIPMP